MPGGHQEPERLLPAHPVRAGGHFPGAQAALRCHRVPRPGRHRPDRMGRAMEPGDHAFASTSGDRFPAAGTC